MLCSVASDPSLHCLLRPVCPNSFGKYGILYSVPYFFIYIRTLQLLYNMVCYNTVLGITRFKDGSQKCIDYKWSFFNIIYTFLFGLTNTFYAMDPNNSVIKRLWCTVEPQWFKHP